MSFDKFPDAEPDVQTSDVVDRGEEIVGSQGKQITTSLLLKESM